MSIREAPEAEAVVAELAALPAPISERGLCALCGASFTNLQALGGGMGHHTERCPWQLATRRKSLLAIALTASQPRPEESGLSMSFRKVVAGVILRQHLDELFTQYPGHAGDLHALRRRRRRSEFVHVALEIGSPKIKMACRQLTQLASMYSSRDGGARTLREALVASEAGGGEPVLVEFWAGEASRVAVVSLKGSKLSPDTQKVIADLKREPAVVADVSAIEHASYETQMLVWALTKRVISLEAHLAKHLVPVPDGYSDLVALSNRQARLVLPADAERDCGQENTSPLLAAPRGHYGA